MPRRPEAGETKTEPGDFPQSPGSALPRTYSPHVAGYARGPFLEPELITPSAWRWRNTRTYVVRHTDGHDYRAVRVSSGAKFVGYWAVERLGLPLSAFE